MTASQNNLTKQFFTTLSVAIICLLLSLYFPAGSAFQKITRSVFFLFIIPVFYIKIILKKSLSDFGFNLQNKLSGLIVGILALGGILLFFFLSQKYPSLQADSAVPSAAFISFSWFVFYELVFVGISLFCLEFFFRGFFLFFLASRFFAWAVVFQAVFYVGLAFFANPGLENVLQATVISFFTGILAWRTRSFLYSYGIMLLASIMIDAYIIHSLR